MTLPVSGAISFNAINVELGVSGATQASLGQSSYRTLSGVASGAISMSNFYGKANQFAFTISSNQTNANLRTLAISAGWNQSSALVATINSGIFVSSSSTGTPALTVNGSFPGGVTLTNNGIIQGMGGAGGGGAGIGNASGGASGGLALSVAVPITINNASGVVAGGGGGGGGGGSAYIAPSKGFGGLNVAGGGGGGGGRTGTTNSSGANQGTSSAPGAGGAGGSGSYAKVGYTGGSGGAGGARGSSGIGGNNAASSPQSYGSAAGGGAGGGAVAGNGNITWPATGTSTGRIS